jgi:hypothetical protein
MISPGTLQLFRDHANPSSFRMVASEKSADFLQNADASREGDHNFTPDSIAQCGCGHFAKLRDFESAGDAD